MDRIITRLELNRSLKPVDSELDLPGPFCHLVKPSQVYVLFVQLRRKRNTRNGLQEV